MIQTPEWVRHAIFYQIFPDRFAQSTRVAKPSKLETWDSKPTLHGFKGGDLLGVAEKLDYLQDLGVNAIYFNPIFQSTANHRYHTQDYFRVDPILGGDAALRELLKEAHKRRIKVIIDGVFNHASRGFYQFSHALENGSESPYLDWFHIQGFPVNAYCQGKLNYDAWWDLPDLPKLNTTTPAVREFIFKVAEHWIEFGVDGWRLDVPAEINDDAFWQEFRRRVKAINPEAYIVGEIWHDAQRWLQGDQFDAVMNYQFTRSLLGFCANGKLDTSMIEGIGYAPVAPLDASGFAYSLNINQSIYDRAIREVQLNVLDTHDTARFLSIAKNDLNTLRLAMLCMFTYPGAPCVYYGTEIGMSGGKDPDCRRAFPWDEGEWHTEILEYVKRCATIRKKHVALRTGDFKVIYAVDKCVVYLRQQGDEKLLVALNSGTQAAAINVETREVLPDGVTLKVIFGKPASYQTVNGSLTGLTIPKREGMVLKVQ